MDIVDVKVDFVFFCFSTKTKSNMVLTRDDQFIRECHKSMESVYLFQIKFLCLPKPTDNNNSFPIVALIVPTATVHIIIIIIIVSVDCVASKPKLDHADYIYKISQFGATRDLKHFSILFHCQRNEY